ncbi:uncharacterized protein MICPUCDRAFT_55943 [Micromonas pusilla CCMP1545]|uniref:Predicted protein n=1 Tax=Micromonas pusilla (strain CCMP1545) TaxID=564608 RepID=C1MNL0_MICPC|nr:uncharacterized protein MICPUCDRAFT_55943 [Micromonas pusilla CCMP1545]EEH58770.1 predicted protein [Micromonas pusilla CCMP1545]|eukprot:XP_003057125.1 predicted protein [Micromonas pusilla CCMP1545]
MLRQPALLALLLAGFVGRANALNYMAGYQPLTDVSERQNMDIDLEAMDTDSQYLLGGECGGNCKLNACTGVTSSWSTGEGCNYDGSTVAWNLVAGGAAYNGSPDNTNTAYTIWSNGYGSTASDGVSKRTFFGLASALDNNKGASDSVSMANNKFIKLMKAYWEGTIGLTANAWMTDMVEHAFTGEAVGALNFGTVGRDFRRQAITKGSLYLNVFPYIIWELQDAVNDCKTGSWTGQAWDEGLAFYAGNIGGGAAPSDTGSMQYALADKRCQNFNTCADGFTGQSKVNQEIIALFADGKNNYFSASSNTDQCNMIEHLGDRIIGQMLIPLVQGTVRYLYKTSESQSSKEAGELWAFATAILPFVHAVDPDAAARLYNRAWKHDFSEPWTDIRGAIEGTYGGLGAGDAVGQVSCEAVGDLYDETKTLISAGGCYGEDELEDWEIALIVLGTIALVSFLGCGAYAIWSHVKKQRVQKKYDQLLISKTGAMMPVTV